ncbi:MAG: PIN domain-containing protein, partial [Candidatus Marinimicrobia bacterium]|nr:PIN domain-containing protein [Candidatus Neomarinimicrobiota bacterium]
IRLYIYGPQKPGDRECEIYSQALAQMLAAKSKIYIDVLIVSEFINTYARIRWGILGKPFGKFKNFRKSTDFKSIAQDITADIGRIMSHCSRIDDGFDEMNTDDIFTEFAKGDSDFNDQILADLCIAKGLRFVTHDADFINCGLPIITANKRLLST